MQSRTGIFILSIVFGLLGGVLGGGLVGFATGAFTFDGVTTQMSDIVTPSGSSEVVKLVEESATTEVVQEATPSVVTITITKELQTRQQFGLNPFGLDPFSDNSNTEGATTEQVEVGGGTGFVVSEDGLILTNRHVVSDPEAGYTVTFDNGDSYEAEVVDIDHLSDLAIIRIDATGLTPLALGDSDQLAQGQIVIAIGNTLGEYSNTVTKGIVSGLARDLGAGYTGLVQTDAAINEGNSGGPLLNLSGEVIGINTAVDRSGEGVGFAIPINDAKSAVESVKTNGRIIRAGLGVRYQQIDETFAETNGLKETYGAIIRGDQQTLGVIPNSAAAKAGLTEGDIILEVDGTKVGQDKDLADIIKNYSIGDTATLLIRRSDDTMEIKVTFDEIPEISNKPKKPSQPE